MYLSTMAVNITKKTDYTGSGEFSVSINSNESDNIDEAITITEEEFLERLLGARLYNELQTDLAILGNGTPTAQKWLDFVYGVTYVEPNDSTVSINYKGVKRMLKGFVFFRYINEFQFKRTSVGVRSVTAENSSDAGRNKTNGVITRKYRNSERFYQAAQIFIQDHETLSAVATSIIEGPATTYTVTISDTTYLADGDTVTIEDNEYTVANLIENTSFEFTALTGLTFTDLTVDWEPFSDWIETNVAPILLF